MGLICMGLATIAQAQTTEPNPPTWDTTYVKILNPANTAENQATIDAVYAENGGTSPPDNGQWSYSRYALMFLPGIHNVEVKVGYYT